VLDIHTLERRWLKYKAKKYAPFIAIFVMVLFIFVITYNGGNTDKSESYQAMDQGGQSENSNDPDKKISDTLSSNTLEPSMEFIQSFQTSVQTPLATAAIAPKPVALSNGPIPIPKVLNVPDSSSLKVPTVSVSASNDKSLSLNRNESKLDIGSIERRFKETSNPGLGLFIARYYYDQGNYSNAYNFALKTNSINNKMDESWIIFAKSLVKLGKTDQAKKTLQLYISETNSDAARSLLDSIEQGTFK
jgi:tetratricopeptide (TPR) repeat protein